MNPPLPDPGSERVIATGFAYPEGPRFDRHGTLHVVELAAGVVSRVHQGRRVVLVETAGSPNGAGFDEDGTLYICNNGGNWGPNPSTGGRAGPGGGLAAIQAVEPDGTFSTVLSNIDGDDLSSPNDLVIDPAGGLWFTDPVWAVRDARGVAAASASPPGSVCWTDGHGHAVRAYSGLTFPNGIVLSPDGTELYVGETGTGRILAFPIQGRGLLGEPIARWDLGPDAVPDGLALDSLGRLLVAGTGTGLITVCAEDGSVEAAIAMADADITNLCFGGPHGRTLFVTEAALGRVVALEWEVPGLPLPVGPRLW
ncbi:MAG: SMP-30/gluconolactonase/LRE family protein [Beutenbergiaceae bacterium]